ncbi:tetratricopeptide repeat-containing sulfotransferase family protein [Pseudoalteromonas piscicida]|uniref:tetratricopeptide repeat-containing sulfotransferase family protein n=1 Tax=Pseudoalteromonas piscicida TaxID=43662 RepID=UPI0030AF963E
MTPNHQIQQYIQQRQFQLAHQALLTRIQQDSSDHQAYALLAELNTVLGNLTKALKIYDKCINLSALPRYYLSAAKLALFTHDPLVAQRYITKLIGTKQLSAIEHDTLANILLRLNQYTDAGRHFQLAYQLSPHIPALALNYAMHLKMSGHIDNAKTLLEVLVKRTPNDAQCQLAYSELSPKHQATARIAELNTAITQQAAPAELQRLHHAVALEYEKQAQYSEAWQHFTASKQAISSLVSYIPEQITAYFQTLTALLNQPIAFAQCHHIAPVFVIGMPRSGTSLMEQLLATLSLQPLGETSIVPQSLKFSHDYQSNTHNITRAYESAKVTQQYAQFVTQAFTATKRFVDKQPFHFLFVDLLAKAFPNAKFVVMKRDRTDTCIANYRQLYQTNSPFHGYAFRFADIQHMYDESYAFLHCAQHKHPAQIKIVSYESLVNHPCEVMTELCQFLDIVWQEDALQFYKKDYYSATASKLQIRQPLNNQSIGRFKGKYPI